MDRNSTPMFVTSRTRSKQVTLADFRPLPPLRRMVAASLQLRCPHCAGGKLYAGIYRLHPRCPVCGAKFEPAGGEWTGALWLAQWFGLTAGLGLWACLYFTGHEAPALPVLVAVFMALLIAATYRHIKAWWIWLMYVTGYIRPAAAAIEKDSGG